MSICLIKHSLWSMDIIQNSTSIYKIYILTFLINYNNRISKNVNRNHSGWWLSTHIWWFETQQETLVYHIQNIESRSNPI